MTERENQQRTNSPLVSERGSTNISDGVVSKLAGTAAGEVEGVYLGGSASRTAGGLLEGITGSQGQSRGVSVEVGRTETAIDITMGIEYGRDIQEMVGRVRDRITERVENLTGLRVTELNVTVSDIVFPDEESNGEGERRQDRRELGSGTEQESRPQARRTEELRTRAQERENTEATTTDMAPGERSRGGDEEEVRAEGSPVDEDETRELRIGDQDEDETGRTTGREDETGREGGRRRDRRRDG
jgi:uncharacterized alkaline shock family protein YloU